MVGWGEVEVGGEYKRAGIRENNYIRFSYCYMLYLHCYISNNYI